MSVPLSQTMLLPLARALEAFQRDLLEATTHRDVTPASVLQRLLHDPDFAWLQPLTTLIVDVRDLAATRASPEALERIRTRVDDLLTAPEGVFADRCRAALHDQPTIAMGLAGVRQALA